MKNYVTASVAYPQSSDAEMRENFSRLYRELADNYAKAAEAAMSRNDRHSVFEMVKQERAMHNAAMRVEKGYSRF